MDTPPNAASDFDPFSPQAIESVQTIESLPYSHAFEHTMYDQAVRRTASHVMVEPIKLSPTILHGKFPDKLHAIFPSAEYAISTLVATQIEDLDTKSTRIELSFDANGLHHEVHTENDKTIYKTENYNGDPLIYQFGISEAIALLATFVYARQFDENNPMSPIDLIDHTLAVPRDASTTLVEQLLMTLGDYDGNSEICTESMFETADGVFIAKFVEGEKPHMSHLHNRLELTQLSFTDLADTILHQNTVNVKRESDTYETQYAERYNTTTPDLIDPRHDYEEWAKICQDFLVAIGPNLEIYKYLDE